ncbi:FtsX-like permease family protein [Actinophytocola glycyrrhizae]|uniref:FtsX-like permease family protein n=1 Tax=Actinophytocola glycyrrhizae TaxID=2044873 RepID=A0ABV9S2N6_9PSEU
MNPVQLAWRVLRVDRRTQVSTVLTALGVAVATGLVLLLTSLPYATQARAERTLWQEATGYTESGGQVSFASSEDQVDGQVITRVDVAPLVDPAGIELPAGIDRLPAPGEMLQSPELAHLASVKPAAELADRFGARPAGLLGEDALMYPEQLVLLVGHTQETMPTSAVELTALASGEARPDGLLTLLAGVGVVVLLVPSLVLVASASRLTAARRERRLAALRLAGATPAQVTAMVGAETGLAAVVGAVLGVAMSPVLHSLATWVPWGGGTWFAQDFILPWPIIVLVAVAVPVLVVGAAVAGLRRVVNTPLMATGGHTSKPLSKGRLLIVPVAVLLFFASLSMAKESSSALLPLLASLGFLMWSPTVVGPWVTSALGGVFTKVWRKPSALLAGRRLRDDPKAAYRASAGVVLAVFAGSMALTLMPSLESEAGYYSPYRDSVLYVGTDAEHAPAVVEKADEGLERYGLAVRAAQVGQVQLKQGENYPQGYVVSCADARVLLPVSVDCRSEPAVYAPSGAALEFVSWSTESTPQGPAEELKPFEVTPVAAATGIVLIDPALMPADIELSNVDVAVPGNGHARESARTALLAAAGGAQVISKEMKLGEQNAELADLRRVTVIGLVTASVLGGLSAAIATAGSVMDRRRTFGALMAAGTPVHTLARALRAEAALPALVATVGAGALGTVVGVGLFGLVSESIPVFSPWLAAPIVLGALVALLAASVCSPALKRVRAEPLADE